MEKFSYVHSIGFPWVFAETKVEGSPRKVHCPLVNTTERMIELVLRKVRCWAAEMRRIVKSMEKIPIIGEGGWRCATKHKGKVQ